jgi:NAD(P)-dependent dehydrogenase (short-subunit alcohol dehydrogenase family)
LPQLRCGQQPRVINVSSLAHRSGAIHFRDLQWERAYKPWSAYAQSKLAMLMFTIELQRRSDANRWGLVSNAAHPGYARTDLMANGPSLSGFLPKLSMLLRPLASQSAAAGALPTLLAATSPEAKGAAYYGPRGFYELKGPPSLAHVASQAADAAVAKRLWEVSEKLTGAEWPKNDGSVTA